MLHKLTGIEGQTVIVNLSQIACAYPADLYGEGHDGPDFDVTTHHCTKISMICGDVLYVTETPEDILALSQTD